MHAPCEIPKALRHSSSPHGLGNAGAGAHSEPQARRAAQRSNSFSRNGATAQRSTFVAPLRRGESLPWLRFRHRAVVAVFSG